MTQVADEPIPAGYRRVEIPGGARLLVLELPEETPPDMLGRYHDVVGKVLEQLRGGPAAIVVGPGVRVHWDLPDGTAYVRVRGAELLETLAEGWSPPVQVHVERRAEDGELDLAFRLVGDRPA